ncbi:MAG: nitrite/sulfite reductase [Nitrosopumilaceae archaeon]|nr:nitrite/sulfite reductase [Nitrosopumilaceae archaeon]
MSRPPTTHARPESPVPVMDLARMEEADAFAQTVKEFRQGTYPEDMFRRYRLQHGAYGTRMTSDYAMIRIKIPAGQVHPAQLERIAYLSEQFSINSAHISTRESIQLHWVVLEDVSEVLRGLAEVGLTSREACGNAVRNVMCSPTAGVCPAEAFDATPYAQATARFFIRNPLNQNLPRKFKFTYSCCEQHGMARIADIGLIPQTRTVDGRTQRGFRVFVGGGLGNKSYVAHQLEDFTPEENILYTSIAVVRLFDRLGNRKNLARNRLRYLVNQMGWDKFRNLILKERDLVRATQSVVVKMPVGPPIPEITGRVHISHRTGETPAGYARWLKSNTFAQKQDGYHTVFVGLEAGDITSTQLRTLSDIIQEYSSEGTGRVGFNQNIAMRYVHEDDLVPLYSRLLESGLAKSGALTMATPIGCSGTTSCNLALTNSHRLAKEVQREFLSRDLDADDALRTSSIKISGCPNSCGQHGIATIGFYGGGGRLGGDMYPSYMLSLGGRADADAVLGQNILRVPAKRVIPVILRIIEIFRERAQPRDDLKSWIHRIVMGGDDITVPEIRNMLSPLTTPPTMDEDPDFYADFGSDSSYHTKTGRGECAA